jgi:outer membrane protein OmpA-like peptidoglycan-associated protein
MVKFLPSLSEVRTDQLQDLDFVEVTRLEAELESEVIRFDPGSAQVTPAERSELDRKVDRIQSWFERAERSGLRPRLTVVGHTDPSGGEATNRRLSRERAENIRAALIAAGLDGDRIAILGAGTTEPVAGPEGQRDRLNRSVTLRLESGSQ